MAPEAGSIASGLLDQAERRERETDKITDYFHGLAEMLKADLVGERKKIWTDVLGEKGINLNELDGVKVVALLRDNPHHANNKRRPAMNAVISFSSKDGDKPFGLAVNKEGKLEIADVTSCSKDDGRSNIISLVVEWYGGQPLEHELYDAEDFYSNSVGGEVNWQGALTIDVPLLERDDSGNFAISKKGTIQAGVEKLGPLLDRTTGAFSGEDIYFGLKKAYEKTVNI